MIHDLSYLPQVLVLISFLIGMFCIIYIRSFDLHEKEPFLSMVAVTCWGGVWSVILSLLIYRTFHAFGIENLKNATGALLVIGPTEELAKLLALMSCYWFVRKEINEPVDGILYMSCVALGFSLIENYFYVLKADQPLQVMVLRLTISTPMHICFSAFMGLAYYLYLQRRSACLLLLMAYGYASLAHGVYDLIIFSGWAFIFIALVVKLTHYWTLSLMRYATARSSYRKSLEGFISEYKPMLEPGIECLNCGDKEPKLTYRLGKELIQKCGHCNHFVTTKLGLFKIFAFFAATFSGFPNEYYWRASITKKKYSTLYKKNWLSEEKEIAYFALGPLNAAIENLNQEVVRMMETQWWFPKNAFTPADESID